MASKLWLATLLLATASATAQDSPGSSEPSSHEFNAGSGSDYSAEFDSAPPAGLSCLTGEPDFGNGSVSREGTDSLREECYVTEAFFIILRESLHGEGYSVSLAPPTRFAGRACEAIETDIHNCINVLPGRSHAYVEAALGVEAPAASNHYRWHSREESDGTATNTVTSVTLRFAGDTLDVMDVFTTTTD